MKNKNYLKFWLLFAFFSLIFIEVAYGTSISVGSAAKNVTTSMSDLARLITAGSYVLGFGFAVGAVLKFKAHKDNPTQVTVGTPIALLFIAVALIFLPAIFGMAEKTIFAGSAKTGTVSGTTKFS